MPEQPPRGKGQLVPLPTDYDDEEDEAPRGWRALLMRAGRILLLATVPVVVLTALTILVVQVRLQHGPISLKAFAGFIERGITTELGDFTAKVKDLEAMLSPEGHLEFRLKDVEIKEGDGDTVVVAPQASFELSRSALWRLRLVPERVFLIEPQLSLHYSREAGLSLSFRDTSGAADRDDLTGNAKAEKQAPAVEGPGPVRHAPLQGQIAPPPSSTSSARSLRRMELARLLAGNSARARRGQDATSYLREFGLKNALVSMDYDGKQTDWLVEEISLDLNHRRRDSVISGTARVASTRGPWSLKFRTEDSERTRRVSLTASVRDLVPSAIGQSVPDLSLLQTLDLPVAGDASLELSTTGILHSANLVVELGAGNIRPPGLPDQPIAVDAGLLRFDYEAEARRLTMAPSTLTWGDSHVTLVGQMIGTPGSNGEVAWDWNAQTKGGQLAAEEFGVAPVSIEAGSAEGHIRPEVGEFSVSSMRLTIGETDITASGEASSASGPSSFRLDASSTPMPLSTVKTIWPRSVAPDMRRWVGIGVTKGTLGAGRLQIASGSYVAAQDGAPAEAPASPQVSFAVEATDVELVPERLAVPIEVPRATIRVAGNTAEITVPDAAVLAAAGKRVPVKGLRLAIPDLAAADLMLDVSGRAQTQLAPVLDIATKIVGAPLETHAALLKSIDGKVDAQMAAKVPLHAGSDVRPQNLTAKIKVTEVKSKAKIGTVELQGGNIEVDATEAGATMAGDLILNGVLARVSGKRSFDPAAQTQEPIQLLATLDNSDRTQLGLDLNHLVQGDVALLVTVAENPQGPPKIKVHGNLTDAELVLPDIAWKKPRGREAAVDFDVAAGSTGMIELQNFKVTGDNVAIEGWLSVDSENEVREFYFPDFSLNVVSRLEVQGRLSDQRIWRVKAKGQTFDGRDLFRQLVSLGNLDDNRIRPLRPAAGIDVEAEIGTIIGQSETSLRGFKVKSSERNDKLTALDAQGTLEGGKPLTIALKSEADKSRVISVVTPDAGQAFKLIGFYRNLEKGRAQLEVNLDLAGAADKSGYLWIEDFRVLGDPVVSEVVSNTPETGPGAGPKGTRKVVREQLDFTRLFARFSTGHSQLVLEDAAVKGPLLGATIRGKVDYGTQRLSLGGTYVPLQGINAAFCEIPVVGQIISGTSCEGLLGITYAIQGPISKPQVWVNPFSIAAPGIFREIFMMTNPNPKVLPRGDTKPPAGGRVGSSASPVVRGEGAPGQATAGSGNAIDGWSMDSGSKN